MANWNPMTLSVDSIKINGVKSPGLCRIEGLSSVRDFDVHDQIVGVSGGSVRFKGRKLARFTIKFLLYTKAHWDDYHSILPMLAELPVGKNNKGMSVEHPILKLIGVSAIVIEELTAPELTEDTGEWTVAIKCIEFRKPKVELSNVEAAKATKQDKYDVEADRNTDEIASLTQERAAI